VARPEPETEEQFEREFRRAGLPLLTENYSASEDIFNRAVPLLGLVLILEVLGPLNKSWSTLGNIVAVVTAMVLMLFALGVINRMRGRPFFSLTRKVGRPELAAFVVIPALLPGIISGHWGIASLTALFNLGLLLVILAVAVFFVIFGLLTIGADTVASWTTHPADVWFEFELAGREAAMTRELLRVATAIASFTGLYFAISMLTDDLYRKEFLSRITDEMEATFVRRVEYLKLIGKSDPS